MSTYTLTVNVNSDDVLRLKQAGYKLCIAKRVNGKYDVVWSGAEYVLHILCIRIDSGER